MLENHIPGDVLGWTAMQAEWKVSLKSNTILLVPGLNDSLDVLVCQYKTVWAWTSAM